MFGDPVLAFIAYVGIRELIGNLGVRLKDLRIILVDPQISICVFDFGDWPVVAFSKESMELLVDFGDSLDNLVFHIVAVVKSGVILLNL